MFCNTSTHTTPIILVPTIILEQWLATQPAATQQWLKTQRFKAKSGQLVLVPDEQGGVSQVVLGIKDENDWWAVGALPKQLPAGDYHFAMGLTETQHTFFALAWGLGCYQYDRYKTVEPIKAQLLLDETVDDDALKAELAAITLVRDMITTPTEDFGPDELAQATRRLADTYQGTCNTIVGDDLLTENYPLVHAVGREGSEPPQLIDFSWGDPTHPKLTLVGKGVCYDTGGLSLKPTSGMLSMKKDMGGAAHALGLALLIMHHRLPVRLRVIIPAVENNVGPNSIRPGDVIVARNGKSVEILNTDAEGRLICADALAEASSENPDLIIDFTTLTGAAKALLGTEVPGFFATDVELAWQLHQAGNLTRDIVWPLPLYHEYRSHLDSPIADLNNAPAERFGGTIFAALFLNEFVTEGLNWIHFDIMGGNTRALPGRPVGGEAQGLRATFNWLKQRYA